jgi:hypothetical protein
MVKALFLCGSVLSSKLTETLFVLYNPFISLYSDEMDAPDKVQKIRMNVLAARIK